MKFDKGVPTPPKKTGRPRRWPFGRADAKEMQVGDSFFVSCDPKLVHVARNSAITVAHHAGIRVTTREVEEGGLRGVRVWRVPDD